LTARLYQKENVKNNENVANSIQIKKYHKNEEGRNRRDKLLPSSFNYAYLLKR